MRKSKLKLLERQRAIEEYYIRKIDYSNSKIIKD